MAFGGFERQGGPSQPMAEINVTPLVDVMLVLLVIFIITAPLLSYAIKIDLPNDPAPAAEPAPATVKLSIDAAGAIYWDGEAVSDAELATRMATAAKAKTLPEIHVRADKATRYERIAFVLSSAQQAGLAKVGFVTEPARAPAAGGGTQ
ncbi:MAG: biopolymer transporter ExbD [Burkholderiaceae bacterium]|jgi:biopolymer transport protein ExbD|nr:biopolymer transporter ExbD [Burkholderiaceae bacterium]